ncbi:MAG: PKD domain-containing protein [Bacteroidota bacterium]|nr:PKD domain-containing protein [Bacteroidota bacterium]
MKSKNAFNEYWEPYEVKKGYYLDKEGEKIRAPYWKLFKRWEWYWNDRIDKETGAFPNTTAIEELKKLEGSRNYNPSPAGDWLSMGPNSTPGGYAGLGRLNCVTFHPTDPDTYYVGAASGGIWRTEDDGASWIPLGDTNEVLGVSDIILIDPPTGSDILYIATGDRDGGSMWSLGGGQSNDNNSIGVLKSIDEGASWQSTGLSFTTDEKERVNRLLMDPNDENTLYAATTAGVYKTTNAGVNWSLLTTTAFIDMEFKPGDPATIYGSTEHWNTTKIYRSTNSGASWSEVASYSGIRTELDASPDEPNWVYALVAKSGGGLKAVYKSTNSGASFTEVYSSSTKNLLGWSCDGNGSGGQGSYDLVIGADPNDANTIYVGGVNTWKSTDGGNSFSIVNHWSGCTGIETVHADKHYLAFQNGTSTLFECNDGGLYKTTDGGSNWTELSSGMAISQIYRMGVGQTQADEMIIGLQDNGTKARLSGTWTDVIGGDGFECIVDYTDEDIQYGALYYGDIYRTTNYWNSSTNISGSIPGSGWWITPYVMDPDDHSTLYVGYEEVYKSSNQGNSWTSISNFSGSDLRSLAVAPSDNDYIYAAEQDIIYKTTNSGGSWSDITGSLPVSSANITYVSVKADDPNTVWVSIGGYNSDGVYETSNGGSTWTNISAGLPSIPVMSVIQNKQNANDVELYAGTDVGVYVKVGSNNWIPFNNGLPNVVVTELDIYYDDTDTNNTRIYAASYGRGVWRSDMYSATGLTAAFTAAPTSGQAPLTVDFTDQSTGHVLSWLWYFGDGNTSTDQNPQYTYNNSGTYTVSLVINSPTANDSVAIVDFIVVGFNAPTADFTGNPTSGVSPLTVDFTDQSLDSVNTWNWYFGDGGTSTDQNPQYIYNDPGTYTVSLAVSGPGGSDSLAKEDYITVDYPTPTADFEGDPTSGDAPLLVNFTDLSLDSVNTWMWYFGDGETSTDPNPEHTYYDPGIYTVSLSVAGPGGNDSTAKTDYIAVDDPAPVADFSGDPLSGTNPLTVDFMDLSTGNIDSWSWDFGDGSNSTDQNPQHIYNDPGTYTVSLEVSGPGGSSTETKNDYIQVNQSQFTADFVGDPTSGQFPLEVEFTDLSSGNIDSWKWYFGDGNTSADQNPVNTYQNSGTYSVALKVSGPGGSDSLKKEDYINVLVGLEEWEDGPLSVYPNPFKEGFTLRSSVLLNDMTLYDALGTKIKYLELQGAGKEILIHAGDLNQGIYYCKILSADEKIWLIKLVKK